MRMILHLIFAKVKLDRFKENMKKEAERKLKEARAEQIKVQQEESKKSFAEQKVIEYTV